MRINHLPIRYDYYLEQSEKWELIFSEISLPRTSTVLELCTGWSPKIGLALARYGLNGMCILSDQNETALEVCQRLLEPVAHDFKIIPSVGSIFDQVFPQADLIILNHALDDILLNDYLQQLPEKKELTENEYESMDFLRQYWELGEMTMRNRLPQLSQLLATQLSQSLSKGGKVLISQYPGYQEKLHNMNIAVQLANEFNLSLKTELQKLGFTQSDCRSEAVVSIYSVE